MKKRKNVIITLVIINFLIIFLFSTCKHDTSNLNSIPTQKVLTDTTTIKNTDAISNTLDTTKTKNKKESNNSKIATKSTINKETKISSNNTIKTVSINPSYSTVYPIKYIYGLKTINYEQNYKDLTIKNIPILKSLDPRFANSSNKILEDTIHEDQKVSYNQILTSAINAYNGGDYESCERFMNLILMIYPTDLNANYYSAISFYKQNKIEKAIVLFEKLITYKGSPFLDESLWNLAICYKEVNKLDKMKMTLEILVKSEGENKEKAKELLEKY